MFEIKKLELQLKKIDCAKDEMLLRIIEREQDIERIKISIEAQDKAMLELKEKIKLLQGA